MKTQKFWMAAVLLSGTFYAYAQEVQNNTTTGLGINNGAVSVNLSDPNAVGNGGTFIGFEAGKDNSPKPTSGRRNTFLGHQSGLNNLLGEDNTFSGWRSGHKNLYGNSNSFYGTSSGFENLSGNNNTFMGHTSGYNNTASNNSFFGSGAGLSNSTGEGNVFMGTSAGYHNTLGTSNNFMGYMAGYKNTFGSYNIMIGYQTGVETNADANIFIGHGSGYSNVTGYGNTYLGFFSGFNATGHNNVFLGNNAGKNEAGSNKLVISNSETNTPLIYGDFTANKLVFNGKVGITNETLANQANLFPATAGGVDVSTYQLFVKGGILTEEVRVNLKSTNNWADYVFAEGYNLRPLAEVEQYIAENGHLPNVPSAKQVKEDGIELGDMARIQQEKIEELTLYAIAQDKQIENQNKKLEQQQKEIEELKAAVKALVSQK